MTLDSNQLPTNPESTNVPARINTTQQLAQASFEEYKNSELEVISIAKGRTPFMHTLINVGRGLNGGTYDKIGFNEKLTDNFPEYKWKERDEATDIYAAGASIASGVTALVLATSAGLYKGLIIRNVVTNEQMRIASITNSTTVEVRRATGTVAAAAVASGQGFQVIGSASSKGEASLASFFTANQSRSNYIQKFLTTFSEDDFDSLSNQINGGEDTITEKTIQHALELEKTALFGQKSTGVDAEGKVFYTMEGVIENCKRGWTNDISGSLTKSTLEDALVNPLKYAKDGAYKKIVLCGTGVKSAISALFQNQLRTTQIKDVDLSFESLRINQGEFIFIEHPLLDAQTGYNGIMFVLDPTFCKIVYPTGKGKIKTAGMNGKTRFVMNEATNNFANTEASLVTYMTMQNANSNAFAAIKVV